MNKITSYINCFFDQLEVFEDLARGHNYKTYLHQAVLGFLERETKESAFEVYRSFFDSYRITLEGRSNPFIDLLDVLLSYEERAATLIDKQRDHYVHSVNVFLLGLSIYSQNAGFRAAFDAAVMDKADYPHSYDTKHEEFFYRWGIASLFHDVGYPVEISGKQINKFIDFATKVDGHTRVKIHLEFKNFEDLNTIAEVLPKHEFIKSYYEKHPSCAYVDLLKPVDLLAHKLHHSLGVDLKEIKASLDKFPEIMAAQGFIDHGFYSAIIVLRWYGFLIQSCRYKPEYFFYPILDSASAILLHNYYKNVLLKPPYKKGPLSPREHPIAFLLILCDELQEWNRTAYGILDRKRNLVEEAEVEVSDQHLQVIYIDKDTAMPEQFSREKEALLEKLLDLEVLFPDGLSIQCEVSESPEATAIPPSPGGPILPRQLLDNLEKLAVAIHDHYNQKQLERNPGKTLVYPEFSDLPDTLKYSNLRQARGIAKKLEFMGWEMRPQGSAGEQIPEIPDSDVELLAALEHDEWVRERLGSGWTYGETKNVDEKISPHLVPYQQLSEEVKELDRDTIRHIPTLLDSIGMALYKKEEQRIPPSRPMIARRLPGSYAE